MSEQAKTINIMKVFRRLFSFMKPYRRGLYFAIVSIIVASVFNSLGPFILGKATDALAGIVVNGVPVSAGIRKFITILIVLGVIYLLYCIFKYLSTFIIVGVSEKTIFDLRNKVDGKLKQLPLNYFDTNPYGDILSRVTNDIDTVSTSLQQSIDQILTSISTAVFILIMMLVVSPALTLIGIITVPLALIISMKIAQKSQYLFQEQQGTVGKLNGYVEEMYTGHTVISAYGKEPDIIRDFEDTNETLYAVGWKAQFLSSLLQPITQAMTNLGYVLVAVISGFLCIKGALTIGMIQSFIQYLRQFSQPITQTVQITNILQSTAAAANRVFEFLDETEETPEEANPVFPDKIRGEVTFSHVSFGYLPHKTLIKDVSLEVRPGSKVAIVGPTGTINLVQHYSKKNQSDQFPRFCLLQFL